MIRSFVLLALLLTLGGRATSQVPFVYLDHVAVTVDSATYAAMLSSRFLRDTLASARPDTAVTEDGTWTGTILTGENNWLGLSAAGSGSELALRCEQLGCSAGIAQVFESMAHGSAVSQLRHRIAATGTTPWYYRTWASQTRSENFLCWFYEPYPDSTVPDRALGRKAMNARWYKPRRLLGNIVEVGASLPAGAIRDLINRLSAFRFGAMFTGPSTTLVGPDLRLNLLSGDGGVTRIVFSLNRPKKGRQSYRFGPDCVLTFNNATKSATWTFH